MAEFVEFRAEEWIPELEQMERISLFDSREVKSIARKRREFEYTIQRRTKSKEDFLKYIQFEVDLHRVVKGRREKMGINAKKADIEYAQAKRIARLFKKAIYRFQDDVKLWFSYFKFCQEVCFHTLVSQMLVRMLLVHSDKQDLWVFAAKWEFEQCKSVENARQFLLRGIRFHQDSKILHNELFKLELEYLQIKKKEKEEQIKTGEWVPDQVADLVIKGKLAEVTYEQTVKKIEDVEFKVCLLSLAKSYPNTMSLQNKIFRDMKQNHSEDELTWDTMAKRELEGLVCEELEVQGNGEPMEINLTKERKRMTLKNRIQHSVNVYEDAVKKLNTPKMWSLYLDHLMEINNDGSLFPVFKRKLLQNGMKGALAAGHMTEKYFVHWIDTLRSAPGKHKELPEVLRKATEQHPHSVKLWHMRLKFHLSRGHVKTGTAVFKEANEKIGNVLPLWKLMITYFQTKSTTRVNDIFKEGLALGGDIAQSLKPLYIEWLVQSKGIGHARQLFHSLPEMQHPPCLELFTKMAALESIQPDTSMKAVRRCHELACKHFGSNNADVWLNYVRFELRFGEPPKVGQIYTRATKALEPRQADEFSSKFNFLKTDIQM